MQSQLPEHLESPHHLIVNGLPPTVAAFRQAAKNPDQFPPRTSCACSTATPVRPRAARPEPTYFSLNFTGD